MDFTRIIREACVENPRQALRAQELGADRIELCARLDLDGLTPSDETIAETVNQLTIPVKVMIRPRKGNFVYNDREIEIMLQSIDSCKIIGVSGVVFGMTDHKGNLDLESIGQLAAKAAPLEVTIHKAIDETNDPVRAIVAMRGMDNVHSVLTSGKAPTARQGKEVIKRMIQAAGNELNIIVAGKVRYDNLEELHEEINASEYHGRGIVGEWIEK